MSHLWGWIVPIRHACMMSDLSTSVNVLQHQTIARGEYDRPLVQIFDVRVMELPAHSHSQWCQRVHFRDLFHCYYNTLDTYSMHMVLESACGSRAFQVKSAILCTAS